MNVRLTILLVAGLFVLPGRAGAQVDDDVSVKTKLLYQNLKGIQASSYFLFGQEFFNSFHYSSNAAHGDKTTSDSKDVTGAHPAVLGSDFHYYLEKDAVERGYHTEAVKWAYQQGYAITYDWHVSARGTETFEYQAATKTLVDSIVMRPLGADRAWLYGELDKIIDIMNKDLVVGGDTIPIVFRPWHEMNGSWFWWGSAATTPEHFRALYALTVDYIKARTKSVLFCWSPNTPVNFDYYPGDAYVDLLGVDTYEVNAMSLRQDLNALVDYAQAHDKVAVLSETGNRTTNSDQAARYWNETVLPAIVNDPTGKSLRIAWALTWINAAWSFPYVPVNTASAGTQQSFKDFKNSPHVIFGDAIPALYSTSVITATTEQPVLSPEVFVFPVPARGQIAIEVRGMDGPSIIQIRGITGDVFYNGSIPAGEDSIILDKFPTPGLYLVSIRNGNRVINQKIIAE